MRYNLPIYVKKMNFHQKKPINMLYVLQKSAYLCMPNQNFLKYIC